jgi:hypothetical protein
MVGVLRGSSEARSVRLRSAVLSAVLAAAVVGGGAFYIGHEAGQRESHGPSVDFVHQQQTAAMERLMKTTSQLVAIEQRSGQLLAGRSGAEVDLDAFFGLRGHYTQVFDSVLAEGGRIRTLFPARVRVAAKAMSHADNVALSTLYPDRRTLAQMNAAEISAVVTNSHTARKSQWAAVRRFSGAAMAEMINRG